jgi:hypothetical protein
MKRLLILAAALVFTLTPTIALSGTAYAACGNGSRAKDKVLEGIGATGSDCKEEPLTNVIAGVVNILSLIVGMVAIVMIVLAGFKYITSGGDANKVGGAKQTLVYALVGLVVAALAQVLVHFVLYNINKAVNSSAYLETQSTIAEA